jgi:predicted dehydrogenase
MKILIIGLGSIGKRHADALQQLYPSSEIYALRNVRTNEKYKNVINIFCKNEIPANIDFIIISNITSFHENTIFNMLDIGCPLFIEKPVLSNLKNAEKISERLNKDGIKTYVACNMRFHSCIKFVKDCVEDDLFRINEVNIYSGSFLPEWRYGKDFRCIYSANKLMGGGVHLDLIHEIDYCCWIFGFPQFSECVLTTRSSLKIDAVDSARYILIYQYFNAMITLNYFRRDPKRRIEIVTEDDTIEIDLLTNIVKSKVRNEILFQCEEKINDTYIKQMKYFCTQMESGIELMNNFDYATKVLKLALNE